MRASSSWRRDLDERGEQRVAILEVVIEGAHGDPDARGDVVHMRVAQSLLREQLLGGVEDGGAVRLARWRSRKALSLRFRR